MTDLDRETLPIEPADLDEWEATATPDVANYWPDPDDNPTIEAVALDGIHARAMLRRGVVKQ